MLSVQGGKMSLLTFRQFKPKYSVNIYRKLSSDGTKSNGSFESLRQSDYVPTTYDKYILVWAKKYPSIKDVPSAVPQETMEKARSVSRVRINIIMCVVTGVVCILMIFAGKHAARRGESILQKNLDWHQMQNQSKK
ncbi:UPF0389 protein CG9231-like [Centruroides sculpturatus]|uniref:UPF0389 protein CG9231-like n=1 Tax=Centruroides sculpturatus TaxID=218467 RepID=UPI000C6E3AF9|nr:UPF0389 protein CG9231-like [Centruroides sculpturatus]